MSNWTPVAVIESCCVTPADKVDYCEPGKESCNASSNKEKKEIAKKLLLHNRDNFVISKLNAKVVIIRVIETTG